MEEDSKLKLIFILTPNAKENILQLANKYNGGDVKLMLANALSIYHHHCNHVYEEEGIILTQSKSGNAREFQMPEPVEKKEPKNIQSKVQKKLQ